MRPPSGARAARNRAFPFLLCWLLVPGGCADPERPTDPGEPPPAEPPPPAVKVLAISPEGFPADYSRLPAFFSEAAAFTDAGVLWNGGWRDDLSGGTDAGTPPQAALLTAIQGAQLGFEPLLVFGWRGGEQLFISVPDNPANDWRNQEAAALYGDAVAAIAAAHTPPFLFLGNESDFYHAQDPEDYLRWIQVYEAAYDRVKAASPTTRVGPVFQYEHLAGLGVLAGHTTPRWAALEAHDLARVDVVGLTLYPFFAHATPEEVPDGYLAPLSARTGTTPIVVTETGWPAEAPDGFAPPWEVGASHQTTYLQTISRILSGRPVDAVTWLYLHPPVPSEGSPLTPLEWQIFHSLSLRDGGGGKRPVYDAWEALRLPSRPEGS